MKTHSKQLGFAWTEFYQAVAERLREYQNKKDRHTLVKKIQESPNPNFDFLRQDKFSDGTAGPLEDICPFTVLGTFNRARMKDQTKQNIANDIAEILDVKLSAPDKFHGIPRVHPMDSWFFLFAKDRKPDDIEKLWRLFINALSYSDHRGAETRRNFLSAYDAALSIERVNRKLSVGLHWARPWDFVPFDQRTCQYIDMLDNQPGKPYSSFNGEDYLNLISDLTSRFDDNNYPVHSFPELSLEAWKKIPDPPPSPVPLDHYTIQDILDDGCFLESNEIENLINRLRAKKNLILQGPPGTGKTWIAKRIAYALSGKQDSNKVVSVQFHPNLSYEDFVRGWRPNSEGKLDLVDGFFMNLINEALNNPDAKFIAIIEEINRGHPSHIFGELLTLLESDKRSPEHAIQLCYPNPDGGSNATHIPENVYIIGTMNTADRSLALIDFAFRRRFAFASFEPKLGERWRLWVTNRCGIDSDLVKDIEQRINNLNADITDDLGKDFQIGHSFVTPASPIENGSTKEWFRQVVETEIGPLLEEYWFDSLQKAKETKDRLLENW